MPKIIKEINSEKINVEDTLVDFIKILDEMNQKINNLAIQVSVKKFVGNNEGEINI